MTTVCLLDAKPMSAISGVSVSMISCCCGLLLQNWRSKCLLVSVTLSESLMILHDSLAAASSLVLGARFGGNLNLSNHIL